jgi:hypothetical protein
MTKFDIALSFCIQEWFANDKFNLTKVEYEMLKKFAHNIAFKNGG